MLNAFKCLNFTWISKKYFKLHLAKVKFLKSSPPYTNHPLSLSLFKSVDKNSRHLLTQEEKKKRELILILLFFSHLTSKVLADSVIFNSKIY